MRKTGRRTIEKPAPRVNRLKEPLTVGRRLPLPRTGYPSDTCHKSSSLNDFLATL
ncbi:hypothetical protein [Azospirillum largimobile]